MKKQKFMSVLMNKLEKRQIYVVIFGILVYKNNINIYDNIKK